MRGKRLTPADRESMRDLYRRGYTWGEVARIYDLKPKSCAKAARWGNVDAV